MPIPAASRVRSLNRALNAAQAAGNRAVEQVLQGKAVRLRGSAFR
jgi:hypothetical protein